MEKPKTVVMEVGPVPEGLRVPLLLRTIGQLLEDLKNEEGKGIATSPRAEQLAAARGSSLEEMANQLEQYRLAYEEGKKEEGAQAAHPH